MVIYTNKTLEKNYTTDALQVVCLQCHGIVTTN